MKIASRINTFLCAASLILHAGPALGDLCPVGKEYKTSVESFTVMEKDNTASTTVHAHVEISMCEPYDGSYDPRLELTLDKCVGTKDVVPGNPLACTAATIRVPAKFIRREKLENYHNRHLGEIWHCDDKVPDMPNVPTCEVITEQKEQPKNKNEVKINESPVCMYDNGKMIMLTNKPVIGMTPKYCL